MKAALTIPELIKEAKSFCDFQSQLTHSEIYGVTDGKAVGTLIEHKFKDQLHGKFTLQSGSTAKGIDLPSDDINTDIKVTSIRQPQSSCPFHDASQKIFGLGYNLLIFVYNKSDDEPTKTAKLNFLSCAFIEANRTADYTTTFRLREMLKDGANKEDIIAFLTDKNIPADEITLSNLADRILAKTPDQGYLTISNALQWRLQYGRIVHLSDPISGITKIL